MKKLKSSVVLKGGKFEEITMTELRKSPGEVMAMIELGMVYLVTKKNKPIAVIDSPPGAQLALDVDANGVIKDRR